MHHVISVQSGGTCTTAATTTNFLGCLTSVSSTSYAYDSLGRVALSVQTTAGVPSLPFQYTYNALDKVTQETYPTGRSVVTSYDNAGRVAGVQNQASSGTLTPYASGIAYAADNAVNSLTLGNGILESTTFNARFQAVQIQAG